MWEATAACALAHSVSEGQGGLAAHVMILTPFRLQRELIRRLFRGRHRGAVSSIDQSQGQEKDVVILSLTADTPERMLRHLPAERTNVGWSRARSRLFLIANFHALSAAYEEGRLDPAASALVEVVLDLGEFRSVELDPDRMEETRQKLNSLCSGPGRSTPAAREAAHADTVTGQLSRIPRAERGLILGVHRIRRRRR